MRINRTIFGLAVGLALIAQAHAALADLQISQTTTIDSPGVRQVLLQIPQEQREPLLKMMSPMLAGQPWVTTTYIKGARMRTDMSATTVLVNSATGHAVTMNRLTHKYSIGPYDPFQKAVSNATCTISPTAEVSMLLGYRVQCYDVTMTSSLLPHSTIVGEIWAARDLPSPPDPGYLSGPGAEFQAEMDRIKGMPLAFSLQFTNTPAGDIRVTSTATSVRRTLLPAAEFLIPADYVRGATQTSSIMPSTGYPLGDGMPLDSLSTVTSDMLSLPPGVASSEAAQPGSASPDDTAALGLLGSLLGGTGSPGASTPDLSGLLGGLQNMPNASGTSGAGSMLSRPMLQQLNQELQSLLDGS